jgi:tight adherence protein B
LTPRSAGASPAIDEVARVTQRLAVLLSAGVSPASAWQHVVEAQPAGSLPPGSSTTEPAPPLLGRPRRGGPWRGVGGAPSPTDRIVRAAAHAGKTGGDIAEAVAAEAGAAGGQIGDAWLGLAAAWRVASQAGAPLSTCLRESATSLRELGRLHADLEVALAGPDATARMVMFLPVIGLVFGSLMGFNTLRMLFLTVPGWICLVSGAGLMLAARLWSRHLVRAARVRDPTPGLEFDLTAIAMTGGGSVDRARALVDDTVERFALHRAGTADAVSRVLAMSARAGVPAAELLRAEAEQMRRDARAEGQRKAATLGVTLMIPLGVCVLPAFMLVGVVPLLLTVLASTLPQF